MIKHTVKHFFQPTSNSCSQASTAMLLSFFGQDMTPEEVMKKVPVNLGEDGTPFGTIYQHIATWLLTQGYDGTMYTADFQVIDLSWQKLNKDELLKRMEAVKSTREVSSLGKSWPEIYMQSYIDFIEAGGDLHIRPYMTTKLIDTLLPDSPIIVCVCYNVLYNCGRSVDAGVRKAKDDDLNGKLANHTIVITGKDSDGNYLISDPWNGSDTVEVEPERLLASMTASQMECDNLIVQIKKKEQD